MTPQMQSGITAGGPGLLYQLPRGKAFVLERERARVTLQEGFASESSSLPAHVCVCVCVSISWLGSRAAAKHGRIAGEP